MRAGVADFEQVTGIGAALARSLYDHLHPGALMPDRPVTAMLWNLPNTLTWLRIAAIPLIVLLFYMPYPWADPAAGCCSPPPASPIRSTAISRAASGRPRASARSSIRWPTS